MTTAAQTRAALHAQLLDIERQHRAALDTERNILRAAQERLKAVNARIEAVRPRVLLDDRAADPYQALILERGALHQTVALAEQTVRQTSRGAEPPLAKATFKDQPGYDVHEGPKGKNRWMREMGQDGRMSNSDGDFLEGRSRSRGESPKHIKPVAPGTLPAEQLSKLEGDAKAYVLKNGGKTGNEHMVAIDLQTGKRLAQGTSHDPGRVYLPDEVTQLASDPTRKIAYHHNHPDSYSLSPSDLAIMGKRPGLFQIMVYGHDGSWFRAERNDFREFEMVLDAAKHEIWQQTGLARRRGLFLESLEAHLINLALARAGVIDYRFQLDEDRQRFYANEQAVLENMIDTAVLKIKRIRGF